jgi:hypothetical protein
MDDNKEKKIVLAGDYSFNKFNLDSSRANPFLSIGGKSKRIGISQSFLDFNELNDKKRVDLLFDSDKKAIGIIFRSDKEGKLSLNLMNKQGGYINAKAFFLLNKIDPEAYSGRYHDVKKISSEDGQIFVFELSQK